MRYYKKKLLLNENFPHSESNRRNFPVEQTRLLKFEKKDSNYIISHYWSLSIKTFFEDCIMDAMKCK